MAELGFALEEVDDRVDEGGRNGVAVFYRGSDCKLQIYFSTRAGEINCMIASSDAPNEHGLYGKARNWRYLTEFVPRPDLPLEELVSLMRDQRENFATSTTWLTWLREQIANNFEVARTGILGLNS
ncbi:hypothetical protein [Mycolicibacterium mengxianglii]|uniref:hypothetical protein n=1 Tax=Mycolicibacterium mengxianglii TaxID=2736649 RepID=UPI0018CFF4AD|nr:hypothetical protein [Mycolicibacterium mengxianglii]